MNPRTQPPARPWRWRHLLDAPHRLGFFLALLVLGAAAAWWALVQLQRLGVLAATAPAVPPSLVHGAAMTFGFFPLFFAGFLFTAGPRWLGVRGPTAGTLLPALAAQAAGWLVWLAGSQVHAGIALAGLLLAASGWLRVTLLFWRLVRASTAPDRVHPKLIGVALALGGACLGGFAAALLIGAERAAHGLLASGLWGGIALVFVAAAHRMIPFFGAPPGSVLDAGGGWRQLALLAGIAAFEALAVWLQELLAGVPAWLLGRALVELAAGGALLWSAAAWHRLQNVSIRLLAMLFVGLLWFAIALLLQAGAGLRAWLGGDAVLTLAPLHALSMGSLASLMVAMVTRVSAGHAGEPVVAGNLVWALFWLLQAATVLRIAATLPGLPGPTLLAGAAALFAAVVLAWGVRYGSGYGRLAAAPRQR